MKKSLLRALIVVAGLFIFSATSVMAQLPCTADFDCDLDVDANDVTVFLSQFGREPFYDPCPDCYDSPCPCTAQSCDPPAPVEKSGQTISYATGDDGDLERGVTWPNPRFTDNLNGTITDNLTGLIWLKEADCFGTRTWNNALSDSNGLANGQCGLTDGSTAGEWRLPNKKELLSLLDDGYYDPAVSDTVGTGKWSQGDPFNNLQSFFYWSSTTNAQNTDFAWYVGMNSGHVHNGMRSDPYYVWPVRDPL